MAIPGNWLVGDPGHVEEHNRIYQDLASKAELTNALDNLTFQAPVVISDVPPLDEGSIWIDTSDSWYPFPQGTNTGDILTILDPAVKLSVEWVPSSTFYKAENLFIPLMASYVVSGTVTQVDVRSVAALSFAGDADSSIAISPFALPENWSQYSIHALWTSTAASNTFENVLWRLYRNELIVGNAVSSTPPEAQGPANDLTPNQYVIKETQIGGTYTVPAGPVGFTFERLGVQDNYTDPIALLVLELRKEA